MPSLNKLLTSLFILVVFSTSAQADIVENTCQFSVEYSEITFQHPDGCAAKLAEQIDKDSVHGLSYSNTYANKNYITRHYGLARPEACGDDFKQIQPTRLQIVSQIVRHKNTDNVIYKTVRYCAYTPSY